MRVAGTGVGVYAGFSDAHELGVVYVNACAGVPFAGGKMAAGTVLLEAAAAAHLATAPVAWRHVNNRYLATCAQTTESGLFFHAPGPMPRGRLPFVAGFRRPCPHVPTSAEYKELVGVIHAALLFAVLHCEAAIKIAEEEGRAPSIDPLDPEFEDQTD